MYRSLILYFAILISLWLPLEGGLSYVLAPFGTSPLEDRIAKHIDILNGHYCEVVTDLSVIAPGPLSLQRSYVEVPNGIRRWLFLPQCALVVGQHPQSSDTAAILNDGHGHWLTFECKAAPATFALNWESVSGIRHLDIEAISGRHDPMNAVLSSVAGAYDLFLGDGTQRRYEKYDHTLEGPLHKGLIKELSHAMEQASQYLLVKESLPNGNILLYAYDKLHRLSKIELKNNSSTVLLGYLEFRYFDSDDLKVQITSSDAIYTEYSFEYSDGILLLNKVDGSHSYPYFYSYEGQRLKSISDASKIFLQFEYDTYGRIISVKQPQPMVQDTNILSITHAFTYAPEYTEVLYASGAMRRYLWNHRRQLSSITSSNKLGEHQRSDNYVWNQAPGERLISTYIADSKGTCIAARILSYDVNGNIAEDTLYGNLTGQGPAAFTIGLDGIPICHNPEACHTKKFNYSHDGYNVLTRIGDCKRHQITFAYAPKSNRMVNRFIYEGPNIRRRLFYFYNDIGCCTKIIEDNGKDTDPLNHFVDERHVIEITPKTESPGVGLPAVIKKKVLDRTLWQDVLETKVIFHYSPHGQETLRETYNNLEVLCNAESNQKVKRYNIQPYIIHGVMPINLSKRTAG